MKKTRFDLLFVFLTVLFFGTSHVSAQMPAKSIEKDREDLRLLKEVDWPKAYREQNTDLLGRILADEFQMIDGEGGWSNKEKEIEHVRRSKWINKSFRFEIKRLEVFENGTAVVAGRGVAIGPESDPDGGYQYQSSNILIRRDGRWQAISSHVSGFRRLTPVELESERTRLGLTRPGCAPRLETRTSLLDLASRKFDIADAALRQKQALELTDCLADPDPRIRDEVAFTGLSTWLRADLIDNDTRLALADRLLPWIAAKEDPAGFRRSFSALALSEVARADRLKPSLPESVRKRILEAAAANIETIKDYRGYDPIEGWRHSVAHASDLVLQSGLHPATTAAEAKLLLEALAKQIAPRGAAYTHGEPERLARATFFVFGRGILNEEYWNTWFKRIGEVPSGESAMTTLQALARAQNVKAFLNSVAFAARSNPNPGNDRLAILADRELLRFPL